MKQTLLALSLLLLTPLALLVDGGVLIPRDKQQPDPSVLSLEEMEITVEGLGQGHGVGLCQRGATAMAERGLDFREIILHYFPNVTISQLPGGPQAAGR
jgi:hypothetical protein